MEVAHSAFWKGAEGVGALGVHKIGWNVLRPFDVGGLIKYIFGGELNAPFSLMVNDCDAVAKISVDPDTRVQGAPPTTLVHPGDGRPGASNVADPENVAE